jgi:uncharacterized membrane protein YedE/YeeE
MAIKKKTAKKTLRLRPKGARKMAKVNSNESILPYLGFGALFGYFLSKARATDYDTVIDMFMCRDFQLYGVIITAIAVISLGLFLMRRKGITTYSGKPLELEPLAWEPNRLIGAFIMGAGWAIAGTCPGTSLTQIGEGKLVAFFTVAGILAGVWTYRKYKSGSSKEQVC